MKKLIDSLSSVDNWTSDNGCTFDTTSWTHLSIDGNVNQLVIAFPENGKATLTLPEPVDVSDTVYFSIFVKSNLENSDNFKIKFYSDPDNKEYFMDSTTGLENFDFVNPSYTTIDKIDIESVSSCTAIFTNLIAYKEEFPVDIYTSLVEHINRNIQGIQVGTTTCLTGDTSITVSNYKYLDRYSLVKIGTEYHEIDSITGGGVVKFSKQYQGKTILDDYTDEPVYLIIPVLYEASEIDVVIPSIALTGGFKYLTDQKQEIQSTEIFSPDTSGNVYTRYTGEAREYTINLEGIARDGLIIQKTMEFLKQSFNKNSMFTINNKFVDLETTGLEYIDYTEASDILPKVMTEIKLNITEEIWTQEEQIKSFTLTKTVQPI